jgi:hypothetical protein
LPSYGKQLPFIGLAANPNYGGGSQAVQQHRNSFDFLEMQSKRLLEMTGDGFNRFMSEHSVK